MADVRGTADDAVSVAQLPVPCLVVLVGPSGSGKSTWVAHHFAADEIVSADRLRAVVGRGEDDLDASRDAFALLDTIVTQRLGRGLTTVIDSLALDADRREQYREVAAAHGLPCVAIGFDVAAAECRARNADRPRPVPADVLRKQFTTWAAVRDLLPTEGFTSVLEPVSVRHVPARLRSSAALVTEQRERPVGLRFGLQISSFDWSGGGATIPGGLRSVAAAAERVGFDSVWVMDHVRQIPQVGRDWDPMLESYTTLAWLAALTTRVRLGALVTAITLRNVAHLGKILATLDVLSEGRVNAGLGLAWYEREHKGYGWDFPPNGERYARLEDALQLLPMLWGPGSRPFAGQVLNVPETICYPRPVQDRIPIIVGGGGEKKTLRLAAAYADGVNIMGDAAVVARKVAVLHEHCRAADRDPAELSITHFSPALVAPDAAALRAAIDRLRPRNQHGDRFAAMTNAGTVDDQLGRFRELADAGVDSAIVSLPGLTRGDPDDAAAAVERFAPIIEAFHA